MVSLEVIVSVLLVVLTVIGTYLANAHFQRKFALVERLWDEKFKGLTRIFETLSDIGDIIVEVGSIQTTVEKMAKTPIEKIQLLNLECLSISKRHSIPIDELPTIDPLTSGIADESLIAETKSKMIFLFVSF